MSLLEQAELMKTVTNIGPFFPLLVREFIVNLPSSSDDLEDPEYEKVFVRGKSFDISSEVIHDFLRRSAGPADPKPHMNQVAREITGGRNRIWPPKGNVAAANLTAKYSVLYRIGAANWAPTKNGTSIKEKLAVLIYEIGTGSKLDFGSFVIKNLSRQAKPRAVRRPIGFPSLLYGLLLNHHPGILKPSDKPGAVPPVIPISTKLFRGKHTADMVKAKVPQEVERKVKMTVSLTGATNAERLRKIIRGVDEDIERLRQVLQNLGDYRMNCVERLALEADASSSALPPA